MAEPVDPGASAAMSTRGTIILVIPDLIFSIRVAETARALGFTPVEVALPALSGALNSDVALIVIDTSQRDDWQAAINALKADPASATIPILAYGAHVDVTASRAAVAAGSDRFVTRGKLMAELPQLLETTARPRSDERRTTNDEG